MKLFKKIKTIIEDGFTRKTNKTTEEDSRYIFNVN